MHIRCMHCGTHLWLQRRLLLALLACAPLGACKQSERPVSRELGPLQAEALVAHPALLRVTPPAPPASAPWASSLAVLAEGLASVDWMTRLTATSAIACIPGGQALAWLEQRLADVEEDVRAEAIAGLARRPSPKARALLASVQDDDTEQLSLRVLAAGALARPINPCNRGVNDDAQR